jgi:sRNA-binding protein
MAYRPTRDETEDCIRKLAHEYPSAFFDDPQKRIPLKINIASDIVKDGFGATYDELVWVLGWYQRHFGYQHNLVAGAKRVDLNGKVVAIVTEQEAMAARKKITEDHQKKREREAAALGSVEVINRLHKAGRITDCALKKLDAEPLPAETLDAPPTLSTKKATVPFDTMREAIEAVETAMRGPPTPVRGAMVVAALRLVISEADAVIRKLEHDSPEA